MATYIEHFCVKLAKPDASYPRVISSFVKRELRTLKQGPIDAYMNALVAVQTALTGHQSIYELTAETGRLGKQRRALINGIARSQFMQVAAPTGAMYAFPSINTQKIPHFNDAKFAWELLEKEHVLVVPGSGFNISQTNHLRLTFLPPEETMNEVFVRMERVLTQLAENPPAK